jgi:hypothetical protein
VLVRGGEDVGQARLRGRDPEHDRAALRCALGGPQRVVVLDDLAVDARRALAGRRPAQLHEHRAGAVLPAQVQALGLERAVGQLARRGHERSRVVAAHDDGQPLAWRRVQAHADLRHHPEGSERAGHELGQVVPGDVLDDLRSSSRERAVGQRDLHAEHEVARAAVTVAQRPRVAGGDDAADRRALSGRIEREHLAGRGEPRLRGGQRDGRLEDRREVTLVVLDDRVELGDAQLGRLDRPPPAELRAARDDAHAARVPQRGRHPRGVHQKRSARPAFSSGCSR